MTPIAGGLAYFYERNNLLLNPDSGWAPGKDLRDDRRGVDGIAAASQDLSLRGVEGRAPDVQPTRSMAVIRG